MRRAVNPPAAPIRWVGLCLVRDHRVLLARRVPTKRAAPGCWDVIGGAIEAGEDMETALCREAMEEVGIVPLDARHVARHAGHDRAVGPFILDLLAARAWAGGEPRLLGDEHDALHWYDADALAGLSPLASENYRSLLHRLLAI